MTKSKYPLTEKFLSDLQIGEDGRHGEFIRPDLLEAELQKTILVFGHEPELSEVFLTVGHDGKNPNSDTHHGLLLGYQPIEQAKKPVTKEEILEFIEELYAEKLELEDQQGDMNPEDKQRFEALINRLKVQESVK